ncbi:TetR/AcrR family transcriptional regulator [Sphingomonas bacterium]|uniref:TetR/AcrR family transcriptional regulator n=1 Tax=Sphingomonas bacterium TaxID=1895847 RepID=UPI001577677F|nr:TetR/AcrR family transcriptional regulator [Sphingomonas bacterium]
MATQHKAVTRRTQAERRQETQAAILTAALQSLVEEGYAGFSAIGVAARAGVSRGAQEHYYPKKIDLVTAATAHALDEAIAHARATSSTIGSPETAIDEFLAESEAFFFAPAFTALMEIVIVARSDKALAKIVYPVLASSRRELDRIWLDALVHAGYARADAEQFIELSQYLLRGIFFVNTWLPYHVQRTATLEAWRKLAPLVLRPPRPA